MMQHRNMQVIADADEHGAAVLGVLMKATVKVSRHAVDLLLLVATLPTKATVKISRFFSRFVSRLVVD